ncbi:MAG: 16S rRNA (cytosine(1402)-N(4))-methyltransferase RsmH [Bacilli bacterium]|nr:16S rRNA (cytosine(1402)-N(4))-methyltransferase RsmH [Bacilli bacterium]
MGAHVPVLLSQSIEALAIKKDGIYVDLTLGRAGHSSHILRQLGEKGHLYAFDLDQSALDEGGAILSAISPSFTLIHSSFASLDAELAARGVNEVDGILADLGVSSPQFDEGERGFSYRLDAPLDMRMDRSAPFSAYDVVNGYGLRELTEVLRRYGEEKDAYAIAKSILRQREISPIRTTFDLVEAVKRAKSPQELRKKGHPAKQTFQAIRIEVNHEFDALERMLTLAPRLLRKDGRLAIITFMSLDDRATKDAFRALTTVEGDRHGIVLPSDITKPEYHLYSKKPIVPTPEELASNPRSASAKLRVLVKD